MTNVGKLRSEKLATENQLARDIVKTVIDFGVNDRMLKMIVLLLANNIEDFELSRSIVETIRATDENLFLIDAFVESDVSGNQQEDNHGKIITEV